MNLQTQRTFLNEATSKANETLTEAKKVETNNRLDMHLIHQTLSHLDSAVKDLGYIPMLHTNESGKLEELVTFLLHKYQMSEEKVKEANLLIEDKDVKARETNRLLEKEKYTTEALRKEVASTATEVNRLLDEAREADRLLEKEKLEGVQARCRIEAFCVIIAQDKENIAKLQKQVFHHQANETAVNETATIHREARDEVNRLLEKQKREVESLSREITSIKSRADNFQQVNVQHHNTIADLRQQISRHQTTEAVIKEIATAQQKAVEDVNRLVERERQETQSLREEAARADARANRFEIEVAQNAKIVAGLEECLREKTESANIENSRLKKELDRCLDGQTKLQVDYRDQEAVLTSTQVNCTKLQMDHDCYANDVVPGLTAAMDKLRSDIRRKEASFKAELGSLRHRLEIQQRGQGLIEYTSNSMNDTNNALVDAIRNHTILAAQMFVSIRQLRLHNAVLKRDRSDALELVRDARTESNENERIQHIEHNDLFDEFQCMLNDRDKTLDRLNAQIDHLRSQNADLEKKLTVSKREVRILARQIATRFSERHPRGYNPNTANTGPSGQVLSFTASQRSSDPIVRPDPSREPALRGGQQSSYHTELSQDNQRSSNTDREHRDVTSQQVQQSSDTAGGAGPTTDPPSQEGQQVLGSTDETRSSTHASKLKRKADRMDQTQSITGESPASQQTRTQWLIKDIRDPNFTSSSMSENNLGKLRNQMERWDQKYPNWVKGGTVRKCAESQAQAISMKWHNGDNEHACATCQRMKQICIIVGRLTGEFEILPTP